MTRKHSETNKFCFLSTLLLLLLWAFPFNQGVDAAYDASPQRPISNIHLPRTSFPNILLHYIPKSSLWSPSFPLSG